MRGSHTHLGSDGRGKHRHGGGAGGGNVRGGDVRGSNLPGGDLSGRTIGGAGRRDIGDRGSASLWLLAVGLVLVFAGVAGAAVGSAQVAARRARLAADFGALAGAARLAGGPEAACDRASRLVQANHGRLTGCRADGLDLVVTAEVAVTPLPGMARTVSASARAGPVRG